MVSHLVQDVGEDVAGQSSDFLLELGQSLPMLITCSGSWNDGDRDWEILLWCSTKDDLSCEAGA